MIRVFLVHLGRFFRMLLVSAFISVLAVPLIFGAAEIFFGRFARQDFMYLVTAGVATGVSLLYTWYSRNRINSDEVLFFVRNRLVANRRMFYHLLTIQAIAAVRAGQVDLQGRIDELYDALKKQNTATDPGAAADEASASSAADGGTGKDGQSGPGKRAGKGDSAGQEESAGQGAAAAAAQAEDCAPGQGEALRWAPAIKWPGSSEKSGGSARKLLEQAREQACEEALIYISAFMASTGAQGRRLERGSKVFLSALLDKPDPQREDSFLKSMNRQCGPYLCELTFVLIIRSLMSIDPFKKGFIDYRLILEQPLIKHWGSLLVGVPEEQINGDYYNRYFFLLNQEQARQREIWIIQQMQAAQAARQAFDGAGATGTANGAGAAGAAGTGAGDGSHSHGGADYGQYSYSYSYSNGQWHYQGSSGPEDHYDHEESGSSEYSSGHTEGTAGTGAEDRDAGSAESGWSAGAQSTGGSGATGAGGRGHRESFRSSTGGAGTYSGGGRFLSRLEKAYITLGLEFNSPLDKVRRQYRRLAFKYHPDHIADYDSFSQSQKEELNAQFLAIVAAYEIIIKDQASR